MCNCSDFDSPKIFKKVSRRARKRHRCVECAGLIEPGDRYWNISGLWGDKWSTFVTCEPCHALADDLLDCYIFGELAEWIEETYDLRDRREPHGARVAVAGMKRRQRRAERILHQETQANSTPACRGSPARLAR
jgi:hypothetical protein